jgi:FkbM family methyltransferase
MKEFFKKIIPSRYHYRLAELGKKLVHTGRKSSYSQFGEDQVITKLLADREGCYVDVGAHHPERYSNTLLLYERGWHGVNIDPNPDTIALFNKKRPNDINICIGIGKNARTLTYHRFSDPAVNTFNAQEAKRWVHKNWIAYLGVTQVEVKPLQTVLAEIELPRIDLLSIDAEGMDLEVLESLDWKKYMPRIICVEAGEFDEKEPTKNKIFSFLSAHGYRVVAVCGPSLVFDRKP